MMTPVIHSGSSETWAPGGATFVTAGPWAGRFCSPACAVKHSTERFSIPMILAKSQNSNATSTANSAVLRDIVEGPDKALYLLTSNPRRSRRGRTPMTTAVNIDIFFQ
jgi:hypothetical protein